MDDIDQLAGQYGVKPVVPTPSNGDWSAGLPRYGETPAAPAAPQSYLQRIGSDIAKVPGELGSAILTGGQRLREGVQTRNIVEATQGLAGGLGQGLGAIAKGVASPVTEAVPPIMDAAMKKGQQIADTQTKLPPVIPDLSQEQIDKAKSALGTIMQNHPYLTENIKSIADILSAIPAVKGAESVVQGGKAAIEAAPGVLQKMAAGPSTEAVAAKTAAQAAKHKDALVTLLKENEGTISNAMDKQAIAKGRKTVTQTKLGTKVDYTPTKEIERASEILQKESDINPGVDTPDVVSKKIKAVIAQRGQGAVQTLRATPQYVSNLDHANMISKLRTEAEEVLTKSEMKPFDEQIALFGKQLAKKKGLDTADYYEALKKWEENIVSKLPKGHDALMDPTANARLHAAAGIRKGVRDMIGAKNPEFQPQMYDLASLYEAKDAADLNLLKTGSKTFSETYPKGSKALKVGAGLIAAPLIGKSVYDIATGQ